MCRCIAQVVMLPFCHSGRQAQLQASMRLSLPNNRRLDSRRHDCTAATDHARADNPAVLAQEQSTAQRP